MLVLVTGTGRSGTTLLTETLARHGRTGFISGLDDKLPLLNLAGRFNGALYRWSPQRSSSMRALSETTKLLERGRLRIAPSEAYHLIDRHVMGGFSEPCRDLVASDMTPYLKTRFQQFFASRIEAQGCDIFVQHLTGWPRSAFLREAFPELKVIHVVRDGRAVANSWLQMGWWDGWSGPDKWIFGPLPPDLHAEWEASGRSFPVLAALGWKMLTRAFESARAQFDALHWMDLRYEDFVSDPQAETARMLKFVGLEWTEDYDRALARHSVESHRSGGFRTDLTPAQVREIEVVLKDDLTRWGYAVEG